MKLKNKKKLALNEKLDKEFIESIKEIEEIETPNRIQDEEGTITTDPVMIGTIFSNKYENLFQKQENLNRPETSQLIFGQT